MVRSYVVSKEGVKMINIIECNDYEAVKNLILYYSKIKGAELTKGDEYESKTYTAFRR